jgi:hypothetical protein
MWRPDLDDLVPPTRWPELTLRQYIAIALIVIGLCSVVAMAQAQQRGVVMDCRELAGLIGSVTWARDMQAKRELVIADVRRRNAHQGQALAAAIAHEARLAWHEGLPIDDAMQRAFDRCTARLGEIGVEG